MADTLNVYLENEVCEDCSNSPVNFIHFGALSDDKPIRLCTGCFQKRAAESRRVLNDGHG